MEILKTEKLSFSYDRDTKVIDGIDFALGSGESVGIIGHNGAGKSTFLRLLVGLETVDGGTVEICGKKLGKDTIREIRKNIGYVFQDSDNQLFMPSVMEDVMFGPLNYGMDRQEAIKQSAQILKDMGIYHLKDKPVYKLSGGEKKLVSIATILSMSCDVMLLDEPSVALDPQNRKLLADTLNGISCAKLIASHDLDFVWDTCQKVIILKNGRIACLGKTEEILKNEKLLTENGLLPPLSLTKR